MEEQKKLCDDFLFLSRKLSSMNTHIKDEIINSTGVSFVTYLRWKTGVTSPSKRDMNAIVEIAKKEVNSNLIEIENIILAIKEQCYNDKKCGNT